MRVIVQKVRHFRARARPVAARRADTPRSRWLLALLLLGVACTEQASAPSDVAPVDVASLPGVYEGEFPCANCLSVGVRLWLLSGGIFFLRQDYEGAADEPVERVHGRGTWSWNAAEGVLVLAGPGPLRRFAYDAPSTLRLLTPAAGPHVLEESPAQEAFTDSMLWEGEFTSNPDGDGDGRAAGRFRDCVTGLRIGVVDDARGRDLRRRHRGVSQAQRPVLVSVRARLTADRPQEVAASLLVEELLAIRPAGACPADARANPDL